MYLAKELTQKSLPEMVNCLADATHHRPACLPQRLPATAARTLN